MHNLPPHSDSRVDCKGFRVLLLILLSSIIAWCGFLLPMGVEHSISSRLCWVTWPACCSRNTNCSTLARCGPPSLRKRSRSTWERGHGVKVKTRFSLLKVYAAIQIQTNGMKRGHDKRTKSTWIALWHKDHYIVSGLTAAVTKLSSNPASWSLLLRWYKCNL